jgi:hypothetical protein
LPAPYSANLNTSHADNVNEIIHATDVDALATHVNQLETDANSGGPLDLPGHKTSGDHDSRYVQNTATHTRSKSITVYSPSGTFPLTPIPIWRVPYAITVTAIYAYRVGGTAATINARRVHTSTGTNHLASDFSAPAGPPWSGSAGTIVSGSALYAAGDSMEAMFQSITGTPTLVTIQIDYTEPVP